MDYTILLQCIVDVSIMQMHEWKGYYLGYHNLIDLVRKNDALYMKSWTMHNLSGPAAAMLYDVLSHR